MFSDLLMLGRLVGNRWFEELSNSVVRMLYPTLSRAKFPGDRQAYVFFAVFTLQHFMLIVFLPQGHAVHGEHEGSCLHDEQRARH